jgi:xylulokinase
MGVLLCINGTGSLYRWTKNFLAQQAKLHQMNDEAK